MKFILSIVFCLGFLNLSFGQKSIKDIKVYNMWSVYDSTNKNWKEWKPNDEVFILNYNNSGNIARCRLNDEIIIYTKSETTRMITDTSSNGYEYQEIEVKGGKYSITYTFRFYENNPDFDLELFVGAVGIRFAKK
jgi:hypothetical protein